MLKIFHSHRLLGARIFHSDTQARLQFWDTASRSRVLSGCPLAVSDALSLASASSETTIFGGKTLLHWAARRRVPPCYSLGGHHILPCLLSRMDCTPETAPFPRLDTRQFIAVTRRRQFRWPFPRRAVLPSRMADSDTHPDIISRTGGVFTSECFL